MNNKQLIIIGGGASINEGINHDLWYKLDGHLTCGINYSFKYFNSTFLACMNYTDFYNTNRNKLKKLPLIITCSRPHSSKWLKNTILINQNFRLSGILALYIGIKLEVKEIYLLGFDYSKQNNRTHFYQGDIKHRGIGQDQYYNRGFENRDFDKFKNTKTKIYNVSPNSKINSFSKINYAKFFKKLNDNKYNQKELVKEIRRVL